MSWTAGRTNPEVIHLSGTSSKLVTTIRRRQIRYLGHVLRGSNLEKDCVLGSVKGMRATAVHNNKFMDGIKTLLGRCATG